MKSYEVTVELRNGTQKKFFGCDRPPVRAHHGALLVYPEPHIEVCYAAGSWTGFVFKENVDE